MGALPSAFMAMRPQALPLKSKHVKGGGPRNSDLKKGTTLHTGRKESGGK